MRPLLLAILCGAMPLSAAHAAIVLPDTPAVEGAPVVIRLLSDDAPRAGETVRAVYYPATEVERHEDACTTDAEGQCTWTPDIAGLVRLETSDDDRIVSVRYAAVPRSAVAIFALAGTLLFGGLTWSMRRMLRDDA